MGSDFADTSSELSAWTHPSVGADRNPAWHNIVFAAAVTGQETTLRKKIYMEKIYSRLKQSQNCLHWQEPSEIT